MAPSTGTRQPPRLSRRALLGWGIAGGALVAGGAGLALSRGFSFWTSSPQEADLFTYSGHAQGANALAWSPDGTLLGSSSVDQTVQVWESGTGKTLLTYRGHQQPQLPPLSITWSPDSTRLASAALDGSVHVWQASTAALEWSYQDTIWRNSITRVAWAPDGARIATVGLPAPLSGQATATLMQWDATTGQRLVTYDDDSNAGVLAWSPDGANLATGGYDQTIAVWPAKVAIGSNQGGDAPPPSPNSTWRMRGDTAYVQGITWSPDGTRIASCGTKPIILFGVNGGVRIWNAASGQHVFTYTGHSPSVDLWALAWSPDGKYLASGGTDQIVQVWEAETGNRLLTYRGHLDQPPIPSSASPNAITALAWSPDSARIASAALSGPIHVWRIAP